MMFEDTQLFKEAMGRFASGVTVITARTAAGKHHGMTASAFCSLSLEPPLILVCVQTQNSTYDHIKNAGAFGVTLLAETQSALSNRFAGGIIDEQGKWTPWPADKDKFNDLELTISSKHGVALIKGGMAQLECSLETIHEGGDHGIFVGRIEEINIEPEGPPHPLLYFRGRYGKFEAAH